MISFLVLENNLFSFRSDRTLSGVLNINVLSRRKKSWVHVDGGIKYGVNLVCAPLLPAGLGLPLEAGKHLWNSTSAVTCALDDPTPGNVAVVLLAEEGLLDVVFVKLMELRPGLCTPLAVAVLQDSVVVGPLAASPKSVKALYK